MGIMAEDKNKRLLRYLNDAYASEQGGLMALKDIAGETDDPEVRSVVSEHIRVTESQADRLEARIRSLGGGKAEAKGKSMVNTAIAKGSHYTNIFHDKEDKHTQDLVKAYSLEHFEIGMYTSLESYASAIGDTETAGLARMIIREEQQAAEQMERLIPQVAVAAVRKTSDMGMGAGGGRSRRGGPAVMPTVLLVSVAALTYWGVRQLRSGGNGNGSSPSPRPSDLSTDVPVTTDVPITGTSTSVLDQSEPTRVDVYRPDPSPRSGTESEL